MKELFARWGWYRVGFFIACLGAWLLASLVRAELPAYGFPVSYILGSLILELTIYRLLDRKSGRRGLLF